MLTFFPGLTSWTLWASLGGAAHSMYETLFFADLDDDKGQELLQTLKLARLFLWFWHIDVPGTVVVHGQEIEGSLPKTSRVPNKPKAPEGRKLEARNAMRLDPEDGIHTAGHFAVLTFIPLPNQRPVMFHEFGEGSKCTDIELIGFPGGGTYKVIRSCESPLGLVRTLERGVGAMAHAGDVPGYHFKSWDDWLWLEVTTAGGGNFNSAWEIKRALVVLHATDLSRCMNSLPATISSAPFVPKGFYRTPHHVKRAISEMSVTISVCSTPGRHTPAQSGATVSLSGWKVVSYLISTWEQLVVEWTPQSSSTDLNQIHWSGHGWVSVCLSCQDCRPFACMSGRASSVPQRKEGNLWSVAVQDDDVARVSSWLPEEPSYSSLSRSSRAQLHKQDDVDLMRWMSLLGTQDGEHLSEHNNCTTKKCASASRTYDDEDAHQNETSPGTWMSSIYANVCVCGYALMCRQRDEAPPSNGVPLAALHAAAVTEPTLVDLGERAYETAPLHVCLGEQGQVVGVRMGLPLSVINSWLSCVGRAEDLEAISVAEEIGGTGFRGKKRSDGIRCVYPKAVSTCLLVEAS